MAYSFKDPRLAPIFARRQKARLGGTVEDTWERTTWHRILSRHNFDLAFVAVVYLAAIGSAIAVVVRFGLLNSPNTTGQGLQILFGAAVFGTFIELLRRTYDTAVKRLSTIDLFTSEILSIMRVFAAGNIVGEFVRLYDKVDSGDPDTGRSAPSGSQPSEKSLQSGFADSARKENYFSIFDKNSSDLGSLDPAVVNDITAFYHFPQGIPGCDRGHPAVERASLRPFDDEGRCGHNHLSLLPNHRSWQARARTSDRLPGQP
jgi:hypothetical protein